MSRTMFYLVSLAIAFVVQLSGFAAAFALQTEVFYDVVGGLDFIALAVYSSCYRPDPMLPSWSEDTHKMAHTIVFVCSRTWLLLFLAWRAHDRKGDARFDGVKHKFWHFLLFWMVQGMWVVMISMPMLFVNSAAVYKPHFSAVDWIAITGFALGVVIEVVADVQKATWTKAGRVGGFCTIGLWSFSRHPNYFGATDLLWWACIISPAFTMHVLLNIPATGIAQANGENLKRYYEKPEVAQAYSEYRESTSILIPMVGYRYVPQCLKRSLFFDFARYEYRAKEKSEA